MTATLQQMLAEPKSLLELARSGEEVVLTDGGEPVVKLTSVPAREKERASTERKQLVDDVAAPSAASAPDKSGTTPDEIVARLRTERKVLTEAEMERRRKWLDDIARHAAAASTGKTGSTTEEIIDDLRSERC